MGGEPMGRVMKTVAVTAIAACASVAGWTAASAQPASPTATATVTRAAPRCHTWNLAAIFTQLEGAAGNRYVKVRLTHTSLSPCAIYGYGGLKLVGPDPSKPDVPPTTLLRNLPPGPSLVVLAPGQ